MESSAQNSPSRSGRARLFRVALFVFSLFAVGGATFLYARHNSQFKGFVKNADGSQVVIEPSRLEGARLYSAATGERAALTRTAPHRLLIFLSPGDCSVCVEEISVWQGLAAQYDDSQLQVVGVLVRSSLEEARAFQKSYGTNFDLYVDLDNEVAEGVGLPEKTPLKMLLDADGKVLFVDGANYEPTRQLAFGERVVGYVGATRAAR